MTTEFERKHNMSYLHSVDKITLNRRKALGVDKEIVDAGKFLVASGISDVIIDFKLGFLGDMGNLKNEIKTGGLGGASIVLEWINPDDLRHLNLTVSAGRSDHKERYVSASFREIRHYKGKKHENPPVLKISLLPLGKEFSFENSISRSAKMGYKTWLREKILNHEVVWED